MIKPGITTSYFFELSPEEMVERFAQKRWYELELSSEHSQMLLERGNPVLTGRAFKEFSLAYGVSFPQGHLWLDFDLDDENQDLVIEKLKRWIDLFQAIGIKAGVLHAGGQKKLKSGQCSIEQINKERVYILNALIKYIQKDDFIICLENTIRYNNEFEEFHEIIDIAACSKLGYCLDTGHLNLFSGKQAEFIHKAGRDLKALHIHDNLGERDNHIAPFGIGTIKWGEVMQALKEVDYNGLFALEIGAEAQCPMPIKMAKLDYFKVMADYMINEMD